MTTLSEYERESVRNLSPIARGWTEIENHSNVPLRDREIANDGVSFNFGSSSPAKRTKNMVKKIRHVFDSNVDSFYVNNVKHTSRIKCISIEPFRCDSSTRT